MKKDIHPKWFPESKVSCACGNSWTTGSTQPEIKTEVCSNCHPFYTGEQARLIDIEGQVDRFYKKLKARQDYVEDIEKKESDKVSPTRPIEELELGKRATDAFVAAKLKTVGDILKMLEEGEAPVLDLPGVGRKTLIELKKKLRKLGYVIPEAAEEITV